MAKCCLFLFCSDEQCFKVLLQYMAMHILVAYNTFECDDLAEDVKQP